MPIAHPGHRFHRPRRSCALPPSGVRPALALTALALLTQSPIAHAQAPAEGTVDRPAASTREVRTFTFESDSFLSENQPPLYWESIAAEQRPGFPAWNEPRIDLVAPAAVGKGSLRLATRGGSAAVQLAPGVVSVFPRSDYRISAMVRTDGLTHARARVVARLLREDGSPVASAPFVTEPVVTLGQWLPVALELNTDDAEAAFLQIELQLLQPEQLTDPADRRPFEPIAQDFTGGAWFDQVVILQLPRITLSIAGGQTVFPPSISPTIEFGLRDLSGDQPRVLLTASDLSGRVVDRSEFAATSGQVTASWTPALPEFGWYLITATLTGRSGKPLGTRSVSLVSLPSNAPGAPSAGEARAVPLSDDRRRFGVLVADPADRVAASVASMTADAGLRQLWLPLWYQPDTLADVRARCDAWSTAVYRLELSGGQLVLGLNTTPFSLEQIAQAPGATPHRMLGQALGVWSPYIEPAARLITSNRWWLGTTEDVTRATGGMDTADVRSARRRMAEFLADPRLAMPWPGDRRPPADLVGGDLDALITLPPEIPPMGVLDLGSLWAGAPTSRPPTAAAPSRRGDLTVLLELDRSPGLAYRDRLSHLVKQMVAAWASLGPREDTLGLGREPQQGASFLLRQPWRITEGQHPALLPLPELAAFRSTIDRLTDREVVQQLNLGPGVRAFLLGPRSSVPETRGSCLVIWSDGPMPDTVAPGATASAAGRPQPVGLELSLGDSPIRRLDLFGNSTPVPLEFSPGLRAPFHRIVPTAEPIFYEGIDLELVSFLASIELSPAVLSAAGAPSAHTITLRNPWTTGVRGALFIVEPGGYSNPEATPDRSWLIEPRRATIALPPRGTATLPVTIGAGSAEQAGTKAVVLDLRFEADRAYELVRVRKHIELGLPGVSLDLSYRLGIDDAGNGLILFAEVTNSGTASLSAEITALGDTLSMRSSNIEELRPGEAVVKAISFREPREALVGQRIFVVVEPRSGGRLNKSILIE